MKTLDEVITGLDICKNFSYCTHPQKGECPYLHEDNTCDQDDLYRDALFYLKEYRRRKAELEFLKREIKSTNEYIQAKIKAEEDTEWRKAYDKVFHPNFNNPPLTWNELCTMEGKPVWVEILSDEIDLSSRWMLVARETKAHSLPLAYTDDIGHWIFGHEDNLGKTWQAYRKERFNTEYEDIPMEYFENGGI